MLVVECFETLYTDNYGKVYSFIYNISNDKALTEDIVQEVFIKAYRSIDSFRGESKISVWLNKIAYNLFLDLRRKKSSHTLSINDEMLAANLADMKNSLSKEIEQKIMSECVQSKILQLPENYRAPLFLDLHGYSNNEISTILDCSLDNAKIRLHRARKKMKEILDNDCKFYYDERNVLC